MDRKQVAGVKKEIKVPFNEYVRQSAYYGNELIKGHSILGQVYRGNYSCC